MVDNFDVLADWIRKTKQMTEEDFLFLQIIKRRKDNPDATKAQETIKNFYIKSADDLLSMKSVIVDWTDKHNARAYLRLNIRNKRKIALKTMAAICENVSNDNYNIKNCHESVCGQYHHDPNKTWILDLDHDAFSENDIKIMDATVTALVLETGKDLSHQLMMPTKNGVHFITRPFNVQEFHKRLTFGLPYHKDNPVYLYSP